MSLFISIFIWFMIGVATAYVASNRGRDPIFWFGIGLLLGLLGLLVLMLLPIKVEDASSEEDREISPDNSAGERSGETLSLILTPAAQIPQNEYLFKSWFYIDKDGVQHDGVRFDKLKSLWNEGVIDETTFVWSDGMNAWQRLSSVEDLMKGIEG